MTASQTIDALIEQTDLVAAEAAKHQLPQMLVFRINLMRAVADELDGRPASKPIPVVAPTSAPPPARVDLTPAQVRETIEKTGIGKSFTQKAENVAKRIEVGRMTMFRFLENGTVSSQTRASVGLLTQLAYESEVLERPDDGGGVMMI